MSNAATAPSKIVAIRDGLKNILTGRGTSVDKASHNFWHFMPMDPAQIEAAFRASWLIRKIVTLPAQDMTREWRVWSLKADEIKKIEAEERRLKIKSEILKGLIYGRLGGGIVVVGTNGRMASEARDGEKLLYVKALPRHVVGLEDFDWNVDSPTFGEPKGFILSGAGSRDVLHPSRVIVFKGEVVPSLTGDIGEEGFWGDSVVQVVDDAVQNLNTSTSGFGSLIDEAKIDIFKLAGLAETLMQPGGEDKVKTRVETTNTAKSMHRAIYLDGEDDWQQKQINWAGMPDIIKTYLMVAAGAADIPATRLFGKAPDGQNSTGESDDRNYRSMISTKQDADLRPGLEKIDRFLLPAVGIEKDATWLFSPLTTPTEKEQAEIDKTRAETVKIYDDTGLLPRDAFALSVQAKLIEHDTYPALAEELAKLPDEELVPEDGLDPSAFKTPEGQAALQAAGYGKVALPAPGQPAGAKPTGPKPQAAAIADATPRSLFVQRKVTNAREILAWAKSQGFDSTLEADDLHVTVFYSRREIDWLEVETNWGEREDGGMIIKPGGARLVEPLGDRGAIVLLFNSSELCWRHEQIKRAGAEHSFDDYQPHITITYRKPADLNLETVEPYRGAIRLGPELFDTVKDDWTPPER